MNDRVPGVMPAGVARHGAEPLAQHVHNLALALVAPLGAQHYRRLCSHFRPSIDLTQTPGTLRLDFAFVNARLFAPQAEARIQLCWREESMSKLSEKDKHSPVIETGQPTLDQTKPPQKSPGSDQSLLKKEIREIEQQKETKKTGTR